MESIMQSVQPILSWLQSSAIGIHISESADLFPWLESLHVLALVVVVGTIAIVDLRLIGVPAHIPSASRLMRDMLPYSWIAFAVAVVTGTAMFVSRAADYGVNIFFIAKMGLLLLAGANMLIFHRYADRSLAGWDLAATPPTQARLAGWLSLLLWTAIILCGRWIGFTL
jgi:hypothetical protein